MSMLIDDFIYRRHNLRAMEKGKDYIIDKLDGNRGAKMNPENILIAVTNISCGIIFIAIWGMVLSSAILYVGAHSAPYKR